MRRTLERRYWCLGWCRIGEVPHTANTREGETNSMITVTTQKGPDGGYIMLSDERGATMVLDHESARRLQWDLGEAIERYVWPKGEATD